MAEACSRAGCDKQLPSLSILHSDGFCSTNCAKLTYGQMTVEQAADSARHQAYWGKKKYKDVDGTGQSPRMSSKAKRSATP